MDYEAILAQVLELLQRERRLSYRVLKRRLGVDDDELEDLKEDLIYAKKLAVDEEGRVLVWTGDATAEPPTAPLERAPDQAPLAYTPAHLTEKILASRAALEGERKQVTVLFADIKDSTELIRDLDPEAAQQLLDPAIHHMMDAVHRFEGTVNQVLGDGIMALFGAPIAHEDHALRACYAALAMQTALRDYTEEVRRTRGLELRIRVGLNAGEVVVRTIGNDLHMDYSAVGQTTHLAARMEQLATPGTIRLTAGTLRLVEGLVQVNALGPIPVKGLIEPVQVFELVGATAVRQRFQARAAQGLTRFVGRQRELDTLHLALDQAGTGHGQVVALVGEAGVGKSRLVYEFAHSYHTQGWRVIESPSVSYGKATPYFPVIELLKRYCHLEDHDDHRTIRAKVTGQVLTLDETLQGTTSALLALLDALPTDSPFLTLDPPQRRQRTLDALKRVLLRETQVQPLVLVFEDLHWIDAETQALLDSLVESLPTARLLLLVNYRPEYQHGWGSKTYYTQLRLDPLPPASADELLQALLGDDPSLAPLKQLLIARTVGNPFFLEESVQTLVEAGIFTGELGSYRLTQPLQHIQMPATVQTVLAARIDRLPPEEKRLLQTAAVIGTEVPLPLLQAIADMPDEALYRHLAHLQVTEFLYETRLFPEREYTFKHALTHEVAYGSLLQERRRALHARIMETLAMLAGDRLGDYVERLAHHAFRGEVWDKALLYGQHAALKAERRSAYRETIAALELALEALQHLPDTRETREQAIDLRLALRGALAPARDWGRILTVLREAEALAEPLDDARRLGQVSAGLAHYFFHRGAYAQARTVAQRALALATACGAVRVQATAQQFLGLTYERQGDYRRAIDCYRQTLVALDGAWRREHFAVTYSEAFCCARLAMCHAALGMFTEGKTFGEEGLRIAEAVDHPLSLIFAYFGLGRLFLYQGDVPRALSRLERAMGLCQDKNLLNYSCIVSTGLGAAYTLGGRVTDAVPLLTQAIEQAKVTEEIVVQCSLHRALGEAYLRAGHVEDAQSFAEQALALTCDLEQRGVQAETLYLLGEIAMHRDPLDVARAETHYQQALALAEALGMRPLLAHCHLSLGTLYTQTGQREQTRAALTTAIDLYRAMEMTFWLPQVEATLAQVSG